MSAKWDRTAILARLRMEIDDGHAVYDALCGSSITAKMAVRGGASMVTTHCLAYFRMQGPFVDLIIAPHPKLTPAQTRAIASDYGIQDGSTTIRVRRALLFYALKRLGLDVSADVRPPTEQHFVLINRDDIQSHLTRRSET